MVAQPGRPSLADCVVLRYAAYDNVVLDPRDALASSMFLAFAWSLSINSSVVERRDSRTYRSFEACRSVGCFLTARVPCAWPGKHYNEKEPVATSPDYLLCGTEQVYISESRLAINWHFLGRRIEIVMDTTTTTLNLFIRA